MPDSNALLERLLGEHFRKDDSLFIGDLSATSIADAIGTPSYVYDRAIVEAAYERTSAALGPRVRVLFALKANPNVAVAKILQNLGAGAEIASSGELHVARAAGFSGRDIQYAGPGKTEEEIRAAIQDEVTLNIESEAEYEAVMHAASQIDKRPRVAVRVNPSAGIGGARMRMTGGASKFGVDQTDLAPLITRVLSDDVVTFRGLHVYAGTQCFDANAWLEQARGLVAIAAEVESKLNCKVATLNFGGGFGVPVFSGDEPFDLEAAGRGVQAIIEADGRPERRYFVELGRFLVAEAGVFVTRVIRVKTSHGIPYAILDGGMHQHAAAAGLGAIIQRAFPITVCEGLNRDFDQPHALGGPLCTPADGLGNKVPLPALKAGDLVAILASGAYGLTYSNVMFLSHALPAEALVDADKLTVVRTRGRPQDVLRGQVYAESDPTEA